MTRKSKQVFLARLQCSNCREIVEFNLKEGNLPEKCNNCKLLVGWLPPVCRQENESCCYKNESDIWQQPLSKKTEDFLNQIFSEKEKSWNKKSSYKQRQARRAARRNKKEI